MTKAVGTRGTTGTARSAGTAGAPEAAAKPSGKSSEQLHREWLEHPRFRYRGCAPDVDDPSRMAGDVSLPVGAHHGPDAFVVEGQRERRAREAAAVEVCLNCPVMVACDRYANSVTADGRLAEPEGVWGGRRGLERRRAFDQARPAVRVDAVVKASVRKLRTPQKQAVLGALAVCWDPAEVMVRAELADVRTANWQRSQIVRLLGLPKSATRMEVLEAAAGRGLLDGVTVVADDGTVPAVPAATEDVLAEVAGQVLLWPARRAEVVQGAHRRGPGRGVWRAPSLRRKFTAVAGQEGLPLAGPVEGLPGLAVAEVVPLLAPVLLEAAA